MLGGEQAERRGGGKYKDVLVLACGTEASQQQKK